MRHIIWVFFITTIINGMEQLDISDDEKYMDFHHKQDTVLAMDFINFLNQNNIRIEDKTILNIGCSTGILAASLAQEATYVLGISANKNMIDFAQSQYDFLPYLSFTHCSIPNFKTSQRFQLAVIDSCINTIKNKEYIFQCASNNLKMNGKLFMTVLTQENILPLHIRIAAKMVLDLHDFFPIAKKKVIDLIIPTLPSYKEIETMLEKTGFQIITKEEQVINVIRTEDECFDRYALHSYDNPIFDFFTEKDERAKAYCIAEYIDCYISQLKRTEDNKLIEPLITTIIHARKIKNND